MGGRSVNFILHHIHSNKSYFGYALHLFDGNINYEYVAVKIAIMTSHEREREVYTSDIVKNKLAGNVPFVETKIHRLQNAFTIEFVDCFLFRILFFYLLV